MAQFRPQLHIKDNLGKVEVRTFQSYARLKKFIPVVIWKDCDPEGMFVVRSRRGQWGEWFERWKEKEDGKVYIAKQGWN